MEKLSKEEMKKVVGGVMAPPGCSGSCDWQWTDEKGKTHTVSGTCLTAPEHPELCYCSSGGGNCNKPV